MTTTLTYLAWTLVLALVQILVAAGFKRQQDSMQWAGVTGTADRSNTGGAAARLARGRNRIYSSRFNLYRRDTAGPCVAAAIGVIYVPVYGIGLAP